MLKKIYISFLIILSITFSGFLFYKFKNPTRPILTYLPEPTTQVQQPETQQQQNVEVEFVGPRDGVPKGAPREKGFWSFAIVVPGVLSRSGQPTLKDFQWLKENGWKSVINLRIDKERSDESDDAKIPGFSQLEFNYLRIQVIDGGPPSNEQADQFLKFMTNKENFPVLVHCHAGVGRTGTMIALYRYSVQGWPMNEAIKESRKFRTGVSKSQKNFLKAWAQTHAPGNYAKKY